MYYNLDIESQIVNIFKKFKLEDLKNSNDTNNLTDIRDGRLYKKIQLKITLIDMLGNFFDSDRLIYQLFLNKYNRTMT